MSPPSAALTAVPATALRVRLQRRTVGVLMVTQTLGSVGVTAGFAISALVATSLAGSAAQAGLAQSLATAGTVAATLLLARLTTARGRRPGLALGYAAAALGSLVCALAVGRASFPLFLLGSGLFGVGAATNLQSRFAAADLAPPGASARGISLVVWVSTVGAVLGPNGATLGDRLAGPLRLPALGVTYLISVGCFGLGAVAVAALLRPDPLLTARRLAAGGPDAGTAAGTAAGSAAEAEGSPGRATPSRHGLADGLRAIAASRRARFGLLTAVVAQAVMVGVMTWTPVHMAPHGGHRAVAQVLSVHVLGMYAFSPVFGWAAARLGPLRPTAAGSLLLLATLLLGASAGPQQHGRLTLALFGLGVAWSLMFITGSSLLTETVAVEQRPAAQGLLDVTIWTATALSLALSGWVTGELGYRRLCLLCLAVAAPVAGLSLAVLARGRR